MRDIYQYSTPEIIQILGQRERTYRIRLGFTQKELAERAGISVPTLQAFENGTNKDISFSTLLRILRSINQLEGADTLLAEIPESPYLMRDNGEQRQRVRHKKQSETLFTYFSGAKRLVPWSGNRVWGVRTSRTILRIWQKVVRR